MGEKESAEAEEELKAKEVAEEKKKAVATVVDDDGWTAEEIKSLLMLEKLYKGNWEAVARSLKHSAAEARKKFENLENEKEKDAVSLVETLYGIGELVGTNAEESVVVELEYGTVFCNKDMIFDVGQWNEKQDKLL